MRNATDIQTIEMIESVRAFAPASADLNALWPEADREDMFCRLLNAPRRPRFARPAQVGRLSKRWVAVVAASGAVAATVVAAMASTTTKSPLMNTDREPRASRSATPHGLTNLSQIATLADVASVGTLAPGQVAHQHRQEVITGLVGVGDQAGDGAQPPAVSRAGHLGSTTSKREIWTASDGTQWVREIVSGKTSEWKFGSEGCTFEGNSSAAFLSSVPTDPTKLDAAFRAEATEWLQSKQLRTQPDAAALMHGRYFELVEDVLSNPLAPAPLRSALFRTLQLLPEVHVTQGPTETGESADVIAGTFASGEKKQMLVDPATTALLETVDTDPANPATGQGAASTDVVSYTKADVVGGVPGDVVRNAIQAGGPAPTACSLRPTN